MRFLPRGVKREDYARKDFFDVWLPTVAPPAELIAWWRSGEPTDARWKRFTARYAAFLKKDTDARQTVELLSAVASRTSLTIGCYCEDESLCHRRLLVETIRASRRDS